MKPTADQVEKAREWVNTDRHACFQDILRLNGTHPAASYNRKLIVEGKNVAYKAATRDALEIALRELRDTYRG